MAPARCGCVRCIIGGMRGPVVLILLGLLFLIDKWNWGAYGFRQLWPALLIAFGLMKVAEALAPTEGHTGN